MSEAGREPDDGNVAVQAPPPRPADAALERYRAAMRRSRIVYFSIVATLVVALGTWAAVTWAGGEAAHASLHTVAAPPPVLRLAAPSPQPTESWRTNDRLAIGTPQQGGTVITYSAHSVVGRNARTGAQTWSYTRTDRTVCVAAQLATAPHGTTIAVYDLNGNCDEVGAFASDTGRRLWTRTLDMDGKPVNGRPSYQVLPYTFLVASPSVVYAIDPSTGYNRWIYQRTGCAIGRVVLGTAGALISQHCSATVRCKNLKFCGPGPQLLLRDGSAGNEDNKPNGDQVKWNRIGDTSIPVSADQVITSVDRDGSLLYVNDSGSGRRSHRIALQGGPVTPDAIGATATDAAELDWLGGQTYAVRGDSDNPSWQRATDSLPTAVATDGSTPVSLTKGRLTVVTPKGLATIDGATGRLSDRFRIPVPPAGSTAFPLGTGFLVGTPTGTIAYQ